MPGDDGYTLEQLIRRAAEILDRSEIETPLQEARRLFTLVSQIDLAKQLAYPEKIIDPAIAQIFWQNIKQRCQNVPFAYISGEAGFYGREFWVQSCLIPRPETELLIDAAVQQVIKSRRPLLKILDLCTGTGSVGITLYLELQAYFPEIKLCLTDVSEAALVTCRKNCERWIRELTQVEILQTDLLSEPDRFKDYQGFDLIVANPPYIKSSDLAGLQKEVRDFEPHLALDGGQDGFYFYRLIMRQIGALLEQSPGKSTWLFLEHGMGQQEQICEIIKSSSLVIENLELHNDLQGDDRVVGVSLKYN